MAHDVTSDRPAGTSPEVEAVFNGHPTTRPNTGARAVPKARPREGPKVEAEEPGETTEPLPAILVPIPPELTAPPKAPALGRRELRELRDPPRSRKGVKAMLSRLRVGPTPKEIEDIVREVKVHHPKADVREMVRAFELAQVAHEGQLRKSGELFIEHPIGVARILARLGMDSTTIVGALLHDAVEDTDVELEDIEGSFGPEVALIIDGLTKLDKIQFRTKEQERAENLRKMIVAMAKDLRVLIIKLADRLHNMRTLTALAPTKREHVATETLEIYAPLADRLGMQPIRVRERYRPYATAAGSEANPVPLPLLLAAASDDRTAMIELTLRQFAADDYFVGWPKKFGYLLVIGHDCHDNPLPAVLDELASGRAFAIYRVRL